MLYGWLPQLGLFHHSEVNAFNLADDLIEPFRPLVDLLVWNLVEKGLPLKISVLYQNNN